MATPVKVRGITFDPTIGVWIGVAEKNGRWVKATFNVAEEPHYHYELFEKNGVLYMREIAPNGRRVVYQVPWEALDCQEFPTNIACTVDVIKLHAIANGQTPPQNVEVVNIAKPSSITTTTTTIPSSASETVSDILSQLPTNQSQSNQVSHTTQTTPARERTHNTTVSRGQTATSGSGFDIKALLAGAISFILGLLALGNKNK